MSDVDARPAGPGPSGPGPSQPPAEPGGRRRLAPVVALVVAALVAVLVVVLAGGDAAKDREGQSRLLGLPAPTLESTRLDGTGFDLGARRGRWVLVNFFAPWCGPCREEHPELVSFSQRHMTVGDAEVVSVVFDDLEGSRQYFAEHGGEWAVVSDPTGSIALDWGVALVPESFLVDPNGFVVSKLINGVTADGLDALLARAQAASAGVGGPVNPRLLRSWGPWVMLAVALVVVLGVAVRRDAGPRTNADRVSSLAESVRCPACRSQAVSESDVPSAQAIRREIARRVQEGETDDQIRAYLVSRFGTDILLTTPAGGVNSLVWALPVGALVLAAGGLVLAFRRWKVEGPVVTAADRARVAAALAERHAADADPDRVGEGAGR